VSALYVYGVMRADEAAAPESEGVVDSGVEVVEHGDLAALVSEVADAAIQSRRQNLTAHSQVLQRAMDAGTVLPMRFGVVMPDGDTVKRELLGERAAQLHGMLRSFDGRVEMAVSALYREDIVLGEVIAENREIERLRQAIQGKPADATYFERVRLGELVAQAIDAKRAADAAQIVEALRPHATAFQQSDLLHERMVVNSAWLVERAGLDEFDAAVERVSSERAERMQFKLTGPLPPFSFVSAGEGSWA
jgi:hypothetical protein